MRSGINIHQLDGEGAPEDNGEAAPLNYLSNIIDTVPSMIIGVDHGGYVTQWNLGAQRQTGISVENAIGRFVGELIPRLGISEAEIQRAIDEQTTHNRKVSCELDAQTRHEDVTIHPLTAGGMRGAVIRVDDITKTAQMQEEIAAYKDNLEKLVEERTSELKETQEASLDIAKMAGKAEIATGILHNIGNLVTSLVIASQSLRRSIDSTFVGKLQDLINKVREDRDEFICNTEKGEKFLTMITRLPGILSGQKDTNLELLDQIFSSLDLIQQSISAQQSYALQGDYDQDFSIKEEIDQLLTRVKPSIDKFGIELTVSCPEDATISAGKSKFANALLNLVNNARDALKSVHGERKIDISVSYDPDGNLKVAVQDSGVGISAKDLDKIFAYGFTTKHDGHGFGLHRSANDIKEMGWRITVSSKGPGEGSTFTIRIPGDRIMGHLF